MIRLSNKSLTALVLPQAGGAITSYADDARDILRPAPENLTDPRDAACFPCVPYFGRLYGGIDFGGRHWDLAPTLSACDGTHALHGEGWVSQWKVTAQTADSVTCQFEHGATTPGRFPFPYRAEQTFALTDGGLTINLSLANTGATPMPAGLALHPFFIRKETTRLQFTADSFWTPPVGAAAAAGVLSAIPAAFNFENSKPLPAADIDHSFTGFSGEALITDGAQTIRLTSDAAHLHLYAPAGEDFFCLEPITNLPGALTDGAGGNAPVPLEPAETLTLVMKITASDH